MKNLSILLILLAAFFASCQTKAESVLTNMNVNSNETTAKIEETKPLIPPTPAPKLKFDINSKIGFAEVSDDKPGCLRTKNGNLAEKTPVSIIVLLDEPPQKVLTATVEKKLDKSCDFSGFETDDKNPGEDFFYSLNLKKPIDEEVFSYFGIAVIKPTKPVQIQNKLASNDLNGDGKLEYFRFCTGNESLHYTIWTGKPLEGKRIWHSYSHVNYDTVPTCKEKDWE
jgi:hypothetical protein